MGRLSLFVVLLLLSTPGWTHPFWLTVERGSPSEIEAELQADPSLKTLVVDGQTGLHVASRRGDPEVTRLLLSGGVSPKLGGSWTPLHEAALNGAWEVAKLLLAAGADPNAQEQSNRGTPLHVAAFNGHQKVVEALLAGGAKVNARDADGWTALSQARDQGFPDLVQLLKKHGGSR